MSIAPTAYSMSTDEWLRYLLENAYTKNEWHKYVLIKAAYKANAVMDKALIILSNNYRGIESLTEYEQSILLKYRNPETEIRAQTIFYQKLIAFREGRLNQQDDPPCNRVRWHVEFDEESFEEHHVSRHQEREEVPLGYTVDTATGDEQPQPSDSINNQNLSLSDPYDFGFLDQPIVPTTVVANNALPTYGEVISSTPPSHIVSTSAEQNDSIPTYSDETPCATPSALVTELFLSPRHQTRAQELIIDSRLLDQPPSLGILPTAEIPREEGDFVPELPET